MFLFESQALITNLIKLCENIFTFFKKITEVWILCCKYIKPLDIVENLITVENVENLLVVGSAVGFYSFLMERTDFIYEYLKKINKIFPKFLNVRISPFLEFYENSDGVLGNNFVQFVGNFQGARSGWPGFFARMFSCFYCRTTVAALFLGALTLNPLFFLSPLIAVAVGDFLHMLSRSRM
jgi:hypothetical protein